MKHYFVEGTAQISLWIEAESEEAAENDYIEAVEKLELHAADASLEDINEIETTLIEERE